jgi:hypothetical protein
MASWTPKLASIASVVAMLAALCLGVGLVYANLLRESPPSIVLVPSSKGLTRIFVELASFGLGCLGLALAAAAFLTGARTRALALAAAASAGVCVLAAALLL